MSFDATVNFGVLVTVAGFGIAGLLRFNTVATEFKSLKTELIPDLKKQITDMAEDVRTMQQSLAVMMAMRDRDVAIERVKNGEHGPHDAQGEHGPK